MSFFGASMPYFLPRQLITAITLIYTSFNTSSQAIIFAFSIDYFFQAFFFRNMPAPANGFQSPRFHQCFHLVIFSPIIMRASSPPTWMYSKETIETTSVITYPKIIYFFVAGQGYYPALLSGAPYDQSMMGSPAHYIYLLLLCKTTQDGTRYSLKAVTEKVHQSRALLFTNRSSAYFIISLISSCV